MKHLERFLLFLIFPGLLVACSGGSGGGGSDIPPPVMISPSNAPAVAGSAFDTLKGGTVLTLTTRGAVPTSNWVAGDTTSSMKMLAEIINGEIQHGFVQGSATSLKSVKQSTTSYCLYGGTKTMSQTSSTSGTASYSNCSDVSGVTLNGSMSMSNMVYTSTTLSVNIVYDLSVTTTMPVNTMQMTGDMALSIDLNTFAMTMSGSRFSMSNSAAGMGNIKLYNYTMVFSGNGALVAIEFTYASARIGGSAVFQMDGASPLVSVGGVFPSSGVAIIRGADSTLIKVTVLGDENAAGNQVQIEFSKDSGTTYEAPLYEGWANISDLI